MLGRVRELFRRYSSDRLTIAEPAFGLYDEQNRRIGHVDQVTLRGGRLAVAGWATADRIVLTVGDAPVETTPSLARADVAAGSYARKLVTV